MENNLNPVPAKNTLVPQYSAIEKGFSEGFRLVDDVVLKNYITRLPELKVIPIDEAQTANFLSKIRLFKITEMVYEKDESATYKLASVFNSVAATNSAIFTIIHSDGIKTNFYLGIRNLSEEYDTQTSYTTLVNAMKGQFPGIKTSNLKSSEIETLLNSIETDSISSVSCVANNKNKDFIGNDEYLQGLEKLAIAMQGNRFTAIIIANSTSQEQLNLVRQAYENIYTQLSPYANTVVSYGVNTSFSSTDTHSEGRNESHSEGKTTTQTQNVTKTQNTGTVISETSPTIGSKIGSTIGASLSIAGAVIGSIIPGPGTAAGGAIGGAIGGLIGSAISSATNKTVSKTHGGGSRGYSEGESKAASFTKTMGTSVSDSHAEGSSHGDSQNLQLTIQNKPIISMLERIDKQLDRLSEFESIGMWECAAYFMSDDSSVSKAAASTYKAIMCGENSGLEVSAINTWDKPQDLISEQLSQNEQISKYVQNFIHPVFDYNVNEITIPVTPTNQVSGNELAIHMGLPRNSVPGFPVIEHADFGKEVVRYNQPSLTGSVKLGTIFNMGRELEKSVVSLDIESLPMHTFVVGATGSGKSNTIYTILSNITSTRREEVSFMVIEPAKGEYKRVFGHKRGVTVLGTNPAFTKLLKINPFKFPKGIHVLEHIDRIVEIFNVCWPMYAAMPAVLKDAVLTSYSSCGWDLTLSKNMIGDNLYPTFQDLLDQLIQVIEKSAYSEEVKSNYMGSLTTRVRSLTNGLNGQIFSSDEIDNTVLFDSNVIVDLSRIGSQETKSLLMGILVMRLSEHRMSNASSSNSALRHITVLEEAHNILGSNPSSTNTEGESISQKSVEMIANAIAEMRTYGEGFIIADQSPGAVDVSAIRNTNTKIIMRLPEEHDRRIAGKSAALNDKQIDEIARLPQGVAVIYQNDWIEPVLCKVDKFEGKEEDFLESSTEEELEKEKHETSVLINFVAHNRIDDADKIGYIEISHAISSCNCSVRVRTLLTALLREYKAKRSIYIWDDKRFAEQSQLIRDILCLEEAVDNSRKMSYNIDSFSCRLNTLIAQKISNVTDQILLTLSHFLVKAYSLSNSDGVEFYQKWVYEIKTRG